MGDRLFTIALDITRNDQALTAVGRAIERFTRIDVLVNNAGYGQLGFFKTLTSEQICLESETNVFGLSMLPERCCLICGNIIPVTS